MIKTLALIFIALLGSNTQALDFELPEVQIGVGYTWTEKPQNGLWHQQEFDNTIDNESVNYQIGLRFNPWENIYLTTGYKYLGKFGVSADFIANDTTYHEWQNGGKAPPLSHLTGSGKAHGIYFKGEYHFKYLFLTYGVWEHKSEWSVSSPEEWKMRRHGPNKGQIHGPYNIQHKNKSKSSSSWIAGIGVKLGDNFSVLAEIWDTENGGDVPSTYMGKSKVITLLYHFKPA